MKRRRKLKKQVYYFLAFLIIIICLIFYGYKKYQEYLYHQTFEYKLLEVGYNKEDTSLILNNFSRPFTLMIFSSSLLL